MAGCAAGADDCVEADLAVAFAQGRLEPEQRAEIERRIDACARCRGIVAEAARASHADDAVTHLEKPTRRISVADPAVLSPGEQVGRYIVERAIGAGGMGVVSLARDPELHRAVVIKFVRPDIDEATTSLEVRLRREAQAMAKLSHPNVVQIFDIGRHGDRVFLAMEFVAGRTLDAWLIERARSVDEIIAMFRQAGAGLAAAHRAGLVHRDFKPNNVLIDGDGTAKVTDFGLARAVDATTAASSAKLPAVSPSLQIAVTHADAVIGTPAYMAPEQRAGNPVDARTDQYAFALALLDALLGQHPSARKISTVDGPERFDRALAKAGVSARVRSAISRALAHDPDARMASMADLLRELEPPRRRRWWFAALAAGAVGAGSWFALVPSGDPCAPQAPARWERSRVAVQQALARQPELFASWKAEHVVDEITKAVADVGALERSTCKAVVAPATDEATCLALRRSAIDEVAHALQTKPDADPWPLVRKIRSCTSAADELEQSAGRIDRAEREAATAYARGDLIAAERNLRDEEAIAEGVGDDAARGRARIHLLDVARWRGDYEAVDVEVMALEATLQHHHDEARDVVEVALAEGRAFTDVGAVAHAFAAWDRAETAATKLDDASARLRARAGRAWAIHVLQLDTGRAREVLEQALHEAGAATSDARADALGELCDLALAQHDGARASAAVAEMHREHPSVVDQLRAARARGQLGDVAGALADVQRIADDSDGTKARKELARGWILRDAKQVDAALDAFNKAVPAFYAPRSLSAAEQLDGVIARCAPPGRDRTECYDLVQLVKPMHRDAPQRAVADLALAGAELRYPGFAKQWLESALPILITARVAPSRVADVQWQLAQNDSVDLPRRRELALAARATFEAAHRPESAAIDEWLRSKAASPP